MKTELIRVQTILFLVCILLFCGCTSEIEKVTNNPTEEHINCISNIGISRGVDYRGKTFFLNNTDGVQQITTRSSDVTNMVTRSFKINATDAGEKYLGVHIMAASIDEKSTLQKVEVWVNNNYVADLEILKPEWDFVTLKNAKRINLIEGDNIITFASPSPYYPEIDAIQIEEDESSIMREDLQYNDYVAQLRKQKTSLIEKISQDSLEKISTSRMFLSKQTRSAYDNSYSWQVSPKTLDNPDGNYQHKICVPVTYTYHRKLSLSKGSYTFMTGPIDGDDYYTVDPVMYLYKIDDPHNYSFYNDDASGKGRHSQITVSNIPAGDYYLIIRAYSSSFASSSLGKQGLVNVYQNGNLLNSNASIAGYVVDVDSPNTGSINYFTAYTTGIADFFLEDKSSHKAKFFGENYFYIEPMENVWMDDARLRLTKSSSQDRYKMIISCIGAFGAYYGNCDVYGSCQQVKSGEAVAKSFANMKVNDAMYSSSANTTTYNCASWAGGLTYGWTWGGVYKSQSNTELVGSNYGNPFVWDSWDAFFANNPQRYAGATSYTREGAYANNGEIAVWSTTGDISGVTHFSCRGTANNHPHGYAWESKPGGYRRIFHPRDALKGTGYGSIIAYYRDSSKSLNGTTTRSMGDKTEPISLEESIRRGMTVLEEVELSNEQKDLFANVRTRSMNVFETSEISKLYNLWSDKINEPEYLCISNPYKLLEIPEAINLISYCRQNKKDALAFFVNLYFIDTDDTVAKNVSYYMFCNIFSDYADIMEHIKTYWKKNQYNESGAYIAPTPKMFLKKFAKELISKIM